MKQLYKVAHDYVNNYWYNNDGKFSLVATTLIPLSYTFGIISKFKTNYILKYQKSFDGKLYNRPVICIGNLTVGGTGKTLITEFLVKKFKGLGYNPAVVSRGYIPIGSNAEEPDEVILYRNLGIPVAVGKNRHKAIKKLIQTCPFVNIIISDDGLQNTSLFRNVEVVMVDGDRLFGNGKLLPSGPLRESLARLQSADFVVIKNGSEKAKSYVKSVVGKFYNMQLQVKGFVNASYSDKVVDKSFFQDKDVNLVTAIGNPESPKNTLLPLCKSVNLVSFPDHYEFSILDFNLYKDRPIIITKKDWVKIEHFNLSHLEIWWIDYEVDIDNGFIDDLSSKLESVTLE